MPPSRRCPRRLRRLRARGVLGPSIVETLLRRARVIIEHYRRYNQPVDAREVVRRTLATQPPEKILQYRALLEEAVESFIHGFR